MNSRTLVFAAASAAVIAMSGCTTLPSSYHVDAGGKTVVDCSTTPDCPVTLPHHWLHTVYPDEIYVKVPPSTKVTITWTIQGNDGTTFNQDGGITLKDDSGKAAFKCMPDATKKHIYSCSNLIDLTPNTEYRYGIKTKGVLSGFDVDPVIRNGA